MLIATGAEAKVAITVDKDNQQMTVAVDGVERYRWPVSIGHPLLRDAERLVPHLPDGSGPLFQGIRRRADAAFDLLHQDRPRHPRHRFRGQARQPGLAWLRAAVARQRRDALCAGAGTGRAQHHGDADRLLAGRARPQSARPRQHGRRPPRTRQRATAIRRCRRSRRDHAAARYARSRVTHRSRLRRKDYAQQPRRDDGYIYPADGSSNEQRLSGAAAARYSTPMPPSRSSSNITTTAAMPRRRRAITSRGRTTSSNSAAITPIRIDRRYCSPSRSRRHSAPTMLE